MDLSPLRNRDYRLLFIAQAVSLLGTMMTYVALPYQMYQLTGSSLAVGLLGLADLLPLLATAFIGGALADAVDKRRLALATDALLATASTILAVLAGLQTRSPAALYAVSACSSAVWALQRPATEALVPRLVDKHELPAVAALSTLRGSVGMIAGPAVGGVLIASIGLAVTYFVDVMTFVVSLACIWGMRPVPPSESADAPSVAAVVDGFRYARSRQELVGTYVIDFIAMVFGMPLALFPALSATLGGPAVLGWLYAAPAIGALLASLTSRWTAHVHRHGLAVLLAAAAWGCAIIFFGLSATFAPAVVCLVAAGAADAVSGIFRMTMWNQTIPDALRGRLASIEMVSYTSGPYLGHLEAGVVASMFGVQASVISGGALCVVGVVAAAIWLPRFVSYRATRPELRAADGVS